MVQTSWTAYQKCPRPKFWMTLWKQLLKTRFQRDFAQTCVVGIASNSQALRPRLQIGPQGNKKSKLPTDFEKSRDLAIIDIVAAIADKTNQCLSNSFTPTSIMGAHKLHNSNILSQVEGAQDRSYRWMTTWNAAHFWGLRYTLKAVATRCWKSSSMCQILLFTVS